MQSVNHDINPVFERDDPLEDDLFTFQRVSPKLLEHETGLYRTKWFDYRMITPLQATRQYIDAYGEIYRRHFRANFDSTASQYIKTLSVDGIWQQMNSNDDKVRRKAMRSFTGCWRGRQVADAMGIPYRLYIDMALRARLDFWKQRNMPQASQLYSLMVVERVHERWLELQGSQLYLSDDPAYLVQNYAGIPHQDDYHEWLMRLAGMRANPAFYLARFVKEDVLPIDKLAARYDDDMMERIERHLQ